jgi:hypothetical protein
MFLPLRNQSACLGVWIALRGMRALHIRRALVSMNKVCFILYIVYLNLPFIVVPIYDGRPDFQFRDSDFDSIKSLPLFLKGQMDVPLYGVVSVGYSINSYTYTKGEPGALALSPNVLFVIVLGIPNITD